MHFCLALKKRQHARSHVVIAAMLSEARRITEAVGVEAVPTILSDGGSTSGSSFFYPVAILGREVAQNMDNIIAIYTPVIKQLKRIAMEGKFAERLKDLAAFPDIVDRSLSAHRATLMQEPRGN